jgi:Universal stress protein family
MSSLSSELREIAASAKTELKRISESVLAAEGVSGEVFVRSGNVPDVVFAVQQECKADLVVIASTGKKPGHGRAAGSIAEVILRSVPCMVLAIGPHVEERPYHRGTTILFPTDLSPRSAEAIPVAASLSSYPGTLLLVHICAPYPSGSSMDHEMASPQRLREFAESARASGL